MICVVVIRTRRAKPQTHYNCDLDFRWLAKTKNDRTAKDEIRKYFSHFMNEVRNIVKKHFT